MTFGTVSRRSRSHFPVMHMTVPTLSEDILILIFLFALPSVISTASPLKTLTTPPLNFSAVCRSWRSIVSSHPKLWSTIRMNRQHPTESNSFSIALHPSVSYFIAKWFRNSKSAPLSINLDLYRTGGDPAYDELFSLILSQYRRCREIDFRVHVDVHEGDSDPVRVQCSSSTTHVRLTSLTGSSMAMCLDLSDCTAAGATSQPLLRELHVSSGVQWLFPQPVDALYLPNLRELSLCNNPNSNLDNIFFILSACPNISTLHIDTITVSGSLRVQTDIQIIRLLQLTVFTLFSSSGTVAYLLSRLACPSLRSCDISARGVVTPGDIRSYTAFFSRCSSGPHPPLSHLRLSYGMKPDVAVQRDLFREQLGASRELLGLLRNLERLRLCGLVIDDELIEELTVRADWEGSKSDVLCPSLSEMSLTYVGGFGVRNETMEEMIVSRWKSDNMLRKVLLDIPGFKDFLEENERLQECIEEGLELVAYY